MKVQVNNITLNYALEGNGQPLILLHGNGEDHTIFATLAQKLASQFTIYSIDSRNHGESSKTNDFSYDSMAEDIISFVEKLNLKNASIVGFSDGAIIATLVELARANTFDKMVLLGINLKPSDFKPENLEYLHREYEANKDPLYKMMLEEPNIELDSLKHIACPTLIVKAEDELFEDKLYQDMLLALPNAQLLEMKGHDHASYVIDSDALYEDLLNFL